MKLKPQYNAGLGQIGAIIIIGAGGFIGIGIGLLIYQLLPKRAITLPAALSTPRPPTSPIGDDEGHIALAAAESQNNPTNWNYGPPREHNHNHSLKIAPWSSGRVIVFIPTYTVVEWSFEGAVWYPWTTNTGPDTFELFTTGDSMMFFRGREIEIQH